MNKSSKTDLLVALGKNVKLIRHQQLLSQEQLANLCGFDRTYISLVERGKRNISFTNLVILATGLDISVSELTKDIVWH